MEISEKLIQFQIQELTLVTLNGYILDKINDYNLKHNILYNIFYKNTL